MLHFNLLLMIYHYSPFTSKVLNILAIYKTFPHSITSLSVSWSLTSKSLTFTTFSTVLEVEMSLFAIFLTYFISGNSFILTYHAQYLLKVSIFCVKFSCIASYLTVTYHTHEFLYCTYTSWTAIARLIMS